MKTRTGLVVMLTAVNLAVVQPSSPLERYAMQDVSQSRPSEHQAAAQDEISLLWDKSGSYSVKDVYSDGMVLARISEMQGVVVETNQIARATEGGKLTDWTVVSTAYARAAPEKILYRMTATGKVQQDGIFAVSDGVADVVENNRDIKNRGIDVYRLIAPRFREGFTLLQTVGAAPTQEALEPWIADSTKKYEAVKAKYTDLKPMPANLYK